MREGWKRTALADLADFRNGLNFVRGEAGHAVKVVGVGDFQKKETLDDFRDTTTVSITNRIAEEDLLQDNDLLFVRSNGNKALVGRCVLISGVKEPVTFSGFTIRARVKSQAVDHSYLSKVVRSPLFYAHLHRQGGGSSINNLSQEALSDFTFGLPPLPEQRKIAAILRTWDEALDKLAALRSAKERRYTAQSRMFFEACHPSFQGRSRTWQRFELGDVFAERSESGAENERLLSVTMNGGVIDRDDVGRKDTSTEDKSRYKLVLPGDIAYNTMRMWQGVSGLSDMRGIVSPAYTVVTPIESRIRGRKAYPFDAGCSISGNAPQPGGAVN